MPFWRARLGPAPHLAQRMKIADTDRSSDTLQLPLEFEARQTEHAHAGTLTQHLKDRDMDSRAFRHKHRSQENRSGRGSRLSCPQLLGHGYFARACGAFA